jgi:hypothetical protein
MWSPPLPLPCMFIYCTHSHLQFASTTTTLIQPRFLDSNSLSLSIKALPPAVHSFFTLSSHLLGRRLFLSVRYKVSKSFPPALYMIYSCTAAVKMSEFLSDYYLELAAATPLPSVEGPDIDNTISAPPKVQTRSQTLARLSVTTPQILSLQPSVAKKVNKKRKPDFTIFVDTTATSTLQQPLHTPKTPKRFRTSTPRTPLGERTDSANSTPRPSPRLPETPFPFSPADPYWEDAENFVPITLITPPETPSGPPLPPTASTGPPPRPSRRAFRRRPLQSARPYTLLPPTDMLAYQMLGLEDWNVSADTISLAYRRKAAALHPDKVPVKQKKLATIDMQQLNAIKEMLLDPRDRRQYHLNAEIPWVI